jgi:hypothetical protein
MWWFFFSHRALFGSKYSLNPFSVIGFSSFGKSWYGTYCYSKKQYNSSRYGGSRDFERRQYTVYNSKLNVRLSCHKRRYY